jgi:hypothetical protein
MSSSRIIYTPRPDATPELEVSALANVFRFVLFEIDITDKSEAAEPAPEPDGRKDGTKAKGDSAYVRILPETP